MRFGFLYNYTLHLTFVHAQHRWMYKQNFIVKLSLYVIYRYKYLRDWNSHHSTSLTYISVKPNYAINVNVRTCIIIQEICLSIDYLNRVVYLVIS